MSAAAWRSPRRKMRSPVSGKECARITSTSRRLTGGARLRRTTSAPRFSPAMPGTTEQPTPAATSTLIASMLPSSIAGLPCQPPARSQASTGPRLAPPRS